MGVRGEEEDDDEKRSQRLGIVRTDTRTFVDKLGVRERRRRCKTRGARTWRQSGGWTRLRRLGLNTAEASPRRDQHTQKGHSPISAVSENCWDKCRLNGCANWCQPSSAAQTCPINPPTPPLGPAAVPSTSAVRLIRTSVEKPRPFSITAQSRPGSVARLGQWAPGARSQRSLLPGDSGLAPPPLSPRTLPA